MKSALKILAAVALALPLTARAETVTVNTASSSQTFTQITAVPTVAEASDFTAVADTAGSLAGTYLKFYDPNAVCYAPWFKVSGTGSAPTVTGCTAVEVDITTGDTAATVGGALRTALNTAPYTTYFTITGATTHLIVTSVLKGVATDGNIGTSGFTVSKTQGVSGVAVGSSDIVPASIGWKACNASANVSTWMAVGKAVDPETDGARLGPGKCYDCPSCVADTLRHATFSSQAASNVITVVQFKQ